MKFIFKTLMKVITLGIVLCLLLAGLWFALTPSDRENLFTEYVQPLTGMSLNQTVNTVKNKIEAFHSSHMHHDKVSIDDVMNDDLLTHAKRHSDPNFVCPMHPQISKGEPGNCPICGMNLVKKEIPLETESEDHSNHGSDKNETALDEVMKDDLLTHARRHSDPNFVCPMHPQISKGEPGNCPICGMNLVKKIIEDEEESVADKEMMQKKRKIKYWVAPMDANYRRDKPGKSPMGMDLVPMYEELEEKPNTVKEMVSTKRKIKYWVAPMDANYRRDKPGKSPMGMDLVPMYEELEEETSSEKEMASKKRKIKFWVAPMDANYRRDEPGKSPMGMDLVPVYEESSEDMTEQKMSKGLPKIRINPSIAQNMGVRIEKASVKALSRTIKTIGSVSYNEDTLHHLHARSSGWVEELYTRSLGDPVKRGKTLLEYYSPDIVAAQKDYIVSTRAGNNLSRASRTRLKDLNVSDEIINKINRTRKSINSIPIVAKHDGVVTRIGIKNGMYITPGTEIYTIADLSSVWVIVDVFEHQLSWVKIGNKALINVQAVPGKNWEGEIDYIYPELNPKTRTLKVRLKISTPEQQLKPNMFADVTLLTQTKKTLTVPSESIIYYENSPRLVKVVSKNRYQPIEIKLGIKSDGYVEILEGIDEGDDILVSGQFMIDSESNLQASFRRMMEK